MLLGSGVSVAVAGGGSAVGVELEATVTVPAIVIDPVGTPVAWADWPEVALFSTLGSINTYVPCAFGDPAGVPDAPGTTTACEVGDVGDVGEGCGDWLDLSVQAVKDRTATATSHA